MHRSTPPVCLEAGLSADAVGALAVQSARRESAASFQALLAAASDAVRATLAPVAAAEAAALTLHQRDALAAVAADLRELLAALAAGVSEEARCLARRRPADLVRAVLRPDWRSRLRPATTPPAPGPTWVTAAGAAVEALGQTAEHVATLAAAQREASSARVLGDAVADRLRGHRDAVLADVAKLVD